jgi:hypothetical protein
MPPKKAQKTSPLQAVAAYDLYKVRVPYVAPDGNSSYTPRKTKAKAALLRERLLMRARQKKETTGSITRSTTRGCLKPAPSKPATAANIMFNQSIVMILLSYFLVKYRFIEKNKVLYHIVIYFLLVSSL